MDEIRFAHIICLMVFIIGLIISVIDFNAFNILCALTGIFISVIGAIRGR